MVHRPPLANTTTNTAVSPLPLAAATMTPAASHQHPPLATQTPQVVSHPVVAEKAPPTCKLITPRPLSFNNALVNFDTVPSDPLNADDAFKYNSKGELRSVIAKQKARSRASHLIADAIHNSADNPHDRATALSMALALPNIQSITKTVGITDPKTTEMMKNALNQQ